jgi:PAS domain-containing protein
MNSKEKSAVFETPINHSDHKHKFQGSWELDFKSGHESWNSDVFKLLQYNAHELIPSYHTLIEQLAHHDDKHQLASLFVKLITHKTEFKTQIRLKLKSGIFQYFELSGKIIVDDLKNQLGVGGKLKAVLNEKLGALSEKNPNDLFNRVGQILKFVSWEYSPITNSFHWTNDVNKHNGYSQIKQLNNQVDYSYFEIPQTFDLIKNCMEHKTGFENEFEYTDKSGERLFARNIAWPKCDTSGNVQSVCGIIQDLEIQKKEELTLLQVPSLQEQNKRMWNYFFTVSHNFKSHSSNLKLLVDAFKRTKNKTERKALVKMLEITSDNLSQSLEFLQETVSIHTNNTLEKKWCDFETYFNNSIPQIQNSLNACGGSINTSFINALGVDYIPAYMESLFYNMLSNAIKYRRIDAPLTIEIKSGKQNGNTWLSFKDNGLGIDLVRNGEKLFGINATFHRNPEARGLGLFLTHNQIDSVGGKILFESKVDEGSKFTIIW